MKKKLAHSVEESLGQESADYQVGQVSGSLLQKNSATCATLSSLFRSAQPRAASALFVPAPQLPRQVSPEEAEEVRGQGRPQQKKLPKKKSVAEQKLDDRESSLQSADDGEPGARKRKRQAAGEEEAAEQHWAVKRQKLRAHKQEEAVKAERSVFVGNLPLSCTKKTLRGLFKHDGAIESIRFRSVAPEDPSVSRKVAAIKRQAHPLKQSVNAYVVFQDKDGVAKALKRNGVELEKDIFIRVDRVGSTSHDHKRSVFVGNLPFDVKELAMRRHFEECGGVEAVRLVRDKNSGLGKGFGYVLFENSDSVQLALKLDGSQLEGRRVRVQRSLKTQTQKGGARRSFPGMKGGPRRSFQGKKSGPSQNFRGEQAEPKKKKKSTKKKMKAKKSFRLTGSGPAK
ncbi:RNA-binding protein 34 [Entelurus aequoreus]|uniref:RNA-binding protein 34 n=1 Tax=Entelurus aequoreus TaxID=161455 RepID=UPI002B1E1CCF|nr:RNA-binding protein 34 [Entelurus aequoreus]